VPDRSLTGAAASIVGVNVPGNAPVLVGVDIAPSAPDCVVVIVFVVEGALEVPVDVDGVAGVNVSGGI
jgi:hypothetical protein